MPLKLEFELEQPPEDGITCVEFCPSPASPFLLCSSWDCGVRLYDVQHNQLKANIPHPVSLSAQAGTAFRSASLCMHSVVKAVY